MAWIRTVEVIPFEIMLLLAVSLGLNAGLLIEKIWQNYFEKTKVTTK